LDDFSNIGQYILYFGQRFENYKSSLIFWLLYSAEKSYVLILAKNGLGYILGDFFHKLIWSPWLEAFSRVCFKLLRVKMFALLKVLQVSFCFVCFSRLAFFSLPSKETDAEGVTNFRLCQIRISSAASLIHGNLSKLTYIVKQE
jgi:hypothetical protein